MTCLLDVELGVDVFAGVKGVGDVLAGVEQGVKEFFAVFKGVDDVLAGRGAGFEVFFVGVKGVDDVLAGLCLGAYVSLLVSRASMTCLLA